MSYFRGVNLIGITFQILSKETGDPVTTGTVTGYITKDGGIQAELVNSAGGTGINHEGNGQWSVDITSDEMDADTVGLLFIHDTNTGVNVNYTIVTENRPSTLQQTDLPGDPSTEIGKVRILINDNDGQIFIDSEIQFFLDENENIYLAAALGLTVMSSGAALKAYLTKTGTKTTDLRQVSAKLKAAADSMREIGNNDGIIFDIAEINHNVFAAQQIVDNRFAREN